MQMEHELRRNFDQLAEKKVDSSQVFDGVLLKVYRDNVSLPDGNPSVREVIRLYGAVGILPVTKDGKVVVERQFRYPVNDITIEIPAGKLDGPEEDPLAAAKRELLEETGITARQWIPMGFYYPSPAYTDEKILLYMAKDLHFGEQQLDEGEFLNVDFVPIQDLVDMVMAGQIIDGKTQLAILKAARIEELVRQEVTYTILDEDSRITDNFYEKIPEAEIEFENQFGQTLYAFAYEAENYGEYGIMDVSWLEEGYQYPKSKKLEHTLESHDSLEESLRSVYGGLFLELKKMLEELQEYEDMGLTALFEERFDDEEEEEQ